MKKLLVVLAALLMLVGCGGSKVKTTVCTLKDAPEGEPTRYTIKHEDDKIKGLEMAMDFPTSSKEETDKILAETNIDFAALLGLSGVNIKLAKKADTVIEMSMALDLEKNIDLVKDMLDGEKAETAAELIESIKKLGYTCK